MSRRSPEGTLNAKPLVRDASLPSPSSHAQSRSTPRAVEEISDLLRDAGRLRSTAEQVAWLEQVARWLSPQRGGAAHRDVAPGREDGPRLVLLVDVLRSDSEHRRAAREVLSAVLRGRSAVTLLSDIGMERTAGLWSAVLARVARRVLPEVPDDRDLRRILPPSLEGEVGASWLERLAPDALGELIALLDPDGRTFASLRAAVPEAMALLASRACALGLALPSTETLPTLRASPFWTLPQRCEAQLRADTPASAQQARHALETALAECRLRVEEVWSAADSGPVETAVVLGLHVLRDALDRLEALVALSADPRTAQRSAAQHRLMVAVLRAQHRYRSTRALWDKTWRPLSRRIVEHTSSVGRHYITRSREEWHEMVAAGAGGGLITVATAALKLLIASAGLSLFFTGLAASANYAISFLGLQLCGFALATKQPSMTGAALAAAVEVERGSADLSGFSREIAHIARSQVASVIGNLGVVIPGAVLVQWVSTALGHPVVDLDHAHHVIASLQPLAGGTLPYAIATGGMLWLSSVGGGWVENWARCRKLPLALARSRGLNQLLGADRARALSAWIDHHLCGLGSNLCLGLLLGMVPSIAQFFGLGLEVRHVTLSAGSLAFAATALGPHAVLSGPVLGAMIGLGTIAVANLAVSFWLSLMMALRAYGLSYPFWSLLRATGAGALLALRWPATAPRTLRRVSAGPTAHGRTPHRVA